MKLVTADHIKNHVHILIMKDMIYRVIDMA